MMGSAVQFYYKKAATGTSGHPDRARAASWMLTMVCIAAGDLSMQIQGDVEKRDALLRTKGWMESNAFQYLRDVKPLEPRQHTQWEVICKHAWPFLQR